MPGSVAVGLFEPVPLVMRGGRSASVITRGLAGMLAAVFGPGRGVAEHHPEIVVVLRVPVPAAAAAAYGTGLAWVLAADSCTTPLLSLYPAAVAAAAAVGKALALLFEVLGRTVQEQTGLVAETVIAAAAVAFASVAEGRRMDCVLEIADVAPVVVQVEKHRYFVASVRVSGSG